MIHFVIAALALTLSSPVTAAPMAFSSEGNGGNCTGCEWILADGEITSTTASELIRYLEENGVSWPASIRLRSPGGSLIGGLRLGEAIRVAGLHTVVAVDSKRSEGTTGACLSACAFAFLGGVRRTADEGGLGVHQFYRSAQIEDPKARSFTAADLSVDQITSAILIEFVHRMGVDPRFLSIAAATPPTDIRLLTAKEVRELRVDWNPEEFEPWQIEPYGGGVVAFTRTRGRSTTASFFCRRDKVPRLMVTFKGVSIEESRQAFEALGGAKVFGHPVPKGALTLKVAGDAVRFEAMVSKLTASSIRQLQSGDLSVSTDEYAPRSSWEAFSWFFPQAGAAPALQVALRNCF